MIMRQRILVVLTLCLIFLPAIAFATSYYISTSGDDQNSGTNPSMPWQHCPGMDGWSGSGALRPGDTVHFRSQDTWVASSGNEALTAAAGVIYDGGTYGSGTRAKFQATGPLGAVVTIYVSNVTFKNFEVDGNNQSCSGMGIQWPSAMSNVSNILIDNCVIHNVGSGDNYWYGLIVGALNDYTLNNVTITNCKIYNTVHEGIALYPEFTSPNNILSNVTIRGCEIYNTGTANGEYGQGILVKDNVKGGIIEFNYLHDNSSCGVLFETYAGIPGPVGITIRYNIIKGNGDWGIDFLNEAGEVVAVEIYSNLIIDNGGLGRNEGGAIFWSGQNHSTSLYRIYNNTIYSVNNSATKKYGVVIAEGATGAPSIEFKNNIVYASDHVPIEDWKNWFTHSNNLVFRSSGASDTHVRVGITNYDRAGVKTWEATGQNSDPNFKNTLNLPFGFIGTYGIGMIPAADGLSISSGPAIDNGAALGGSYSGAINYSGTRSGLTRPQRGGWDIGAYEASRPKPSPPRNLRVVN